MTASEPTPPASPTAAVPDHSRIHTAIWVLIYGGMLSVCLALFLPTQAELMSLGFMAAGIIAVAVGALLIVIRSRMAGP